MLEFARYVIVFTTFPDAGFAPEAVLNWYRLRWQVEPVFRRFKSVARIGQPPKRDGESARAWLYGKLFTALLAEKLIAHASAVSPRGVVDSHYISTQISRTISARGEDSFPLCSVFLKNARRRRRPVAARLLPTRALRSGTVGTFLPSTRARPAGAGRSSRIGRTVPPLLQKPV